MSENVVKEENKMGVMPVNKLLISMSVPMMLSMLVQALYNIVDSIFVARVSENALTAVSLAFPIQTLMVALGAGTGVGVNALLSRALGEKNEKMASDAAKNGIFLFVLSYLVFLFVGVFIVRPFYALQTTDAEIIEYGVDYLTIVCIFSFGLYAQFIFERLLQSTGRTTYTMVTQMLGAIINLILDPIFIFGWFGIPAMGVRGAAIATVCGQIVAGTVGYFMNVLKNHEIDINMKGFKPSGVVIKNIYTVGIPSIIMQSISSIMVFCLNKILIGFSTTATAVFGVYFKLQSFIFMPVFGLNNGMVPILAYNYGAKKKDRLMQTYKLSVMYAICIMTTGTIVFEAVPGTLFRLFDASEQMLEMGIPALRTIALSFPLAAFGIITSSLFQALGNGVYSMFNSICRQLVVLVPAAYFLSLIGNINYVWFAFPIAEIMAVILTTVFFKKVYAKVIKPLGQ